MTVLSSIKRHGQLPLTVPEMQNLINSKGIITMGTKLYVALE